jgi:hypothetical protein
VGDFLLLSLSYFLLYTTLVKPHPYHIASFVRFCEFNCHYANTGVLTYSNSITSAFCRIRFKKLIGFHCTLYTSKIIVFQQKLNQQSEIRRNSLHSDQFRKFLARIKKFSSFRRQQADGTRSFVALIWLANEIFTPICCLSDSIPIMPLPCWCIAQ